jgi:iron-sulfur cluster repair protein YtfE (RIC family)
MPIPLHIFKKSPGPPDLAATLSECHDRIRNFVGVAQKIGAANHGVSPAQHVPAEQIVSAAADVQRYFRHGLPHHVEDEEKSLIPRLLGRSREVDAALATMEREHREHEAPLARLLALMDQLMASPAAHAQLAAAVAAAAGELGAAFETHLANEEQKIFPALKTLLTPAEQAAILAEIRARRAPLPPGVPH